MAFQLEQGRRAIDQSAAARGGLVSSGTLRDLMNYGQGIAQNAWQGAFNNAANVRNFNFGQDQYNQNFGYNAANNDRDYLTRLAQYNQGFGYNAQNSDREFQARMLQSLLGAGSNANAQGNSMALALAQMLSQNAQSLGQVGAGGTMGQANNINSIIQNMMGGVNNAQMQNMFAPYLTRLANQV
jgi:hypothetical protein